MRAAPLLLLLPLGLAAARLPVVPHQDPAAAQDPDLLPDTMLELESALKKLRRSIRKEEEDAASLASLQRIQEAALRCKTLVPALAADLPEAERPAFLRAYRREMAAFLEKAVACEIALLDGDREKARALQKALADMETPAHERFTADG